MLSLPPPPSPLLLLLLLCNVLLCCVVVCCQMDNFYTVTVYEKVRPFKTLTQKILFPHP